MAGTADALVLSLPNPALVVDATGRIVAANADISTLVSGDVVGRLIEDLVPERLRARHVRQRETYAEAASRRPMGTGRDLVLAAFDGTEIPVEIALSPVLLDGRPATLALVVDARERHARLAELEARARTDALTGLANRATADEDLARRFRARAAFSLLAVDLDGLRAANGRFGHPGGDQLIRTFARRLRSVIRDEDLVARVGGDEFTVAVGAGWRDAIQVANRISGADAPPIEIGGERVRLTASIGIAERRSGESLQALVARADVALFAAKAAGRCAVAADVAPGEEPIILAATPHGQAFPPDRRAATDGHAAEGRTEGPL